MTEASNTTFQDLSLAESVLKSLAEVGYEIPTPIQEQTIPLVLAGRDVVGQAQTGTGKTAAFALPLLSRIDLSRREVQVLVLTPTRELAIQVAEAFQRYAAHIPGFHVLPIYGGQAYDGQLRGLKRGVHVVVGTPGRVMDHMRRKTLRLGSLSCLVLDEADEMLRMGFIDDVEWILEQTPDTHQTALFSATMPEPIRRIAEKHLRDPAHIAIQERTSAADKIRQRHWMVSGRDHKIDALTRILEAEPFDGILIFVRTRTMTVELAEKLAARGYACSALSGDMAQKRREETVAQLKKGRLDILVATDVAARGLDIDRISHVINFDIPSDVESYIHRIGRTGRAGRKGEAILFVAPRERRLLFAIERGTQQKIPLLELPSTAAINDQRIARFKQTITDMLATEDLGLFRMIIEQYQQEHNVTALDMASALAKMVQGDEPLLLAANVDHSSRNAARKGRRGDNQDSAPRNTTRKNHNADQPDSAQSPAKYLRSPNAPNPPPPDEGSERFRLAVGYTHGVKPGNIVGAIANEAELDSAHIGRIEIYDEYSTIDLPAGMPNELLRVLKKVWVCGQRLQISHIDGPNKTYREQKFVAKPGKKSSKKKDIVAEGKTADSKLGFAKKNRPIENNKPFATKVETPVNKEPFAARDRTANSQEAVAAKDETANGRVGILIKSKPPKKKKPFAKKGRTPDGKKDRHRKRK